ncbi:MAG: hypothetical protein M0Q46_04715 [Endomicrobiales bacterium]|jgi:hypothetical protein|nr:hypothetical protein [Endomicrobiales bacterium]
METVETLLQEAEKKNQQDPKKFIIQRNNAFNEQWVLGKFAMAYNESNEKKIVYAERYNDNNGKSRPDFKVFGIDKKWLFDIEVTQEHGVELNPKTGKFEQRRIKKEYMEDVEERQFTFDDQANLHHLQELIDKKCAKKYPYNTFLVVYINIFDPDSYSSLKFKRGSISRVYLLKELGNNEIRIHAIITWK